MKRKVGKIRSINANPFHSTCSIWVASAQFSPPGNSEHTATTIEAKPIIHIMSKPLKASRLSNRLFSIYYFLLFRKYRSLSS